MKKVRVSTSLSLLGILLMALLALPQTLGQSNTARFAVIGDYGNAGKPESDVANLVKLWIPDFVITTGDNNYPDGAASTIDDNIGQYYHSFICPYKGNYGLGATNNEFWPCLGNHDWHATGALPYLNYFTLPGNERYYTFTRGPVQFFSLDSDSSEPDGRSSTSKQAMWLKSQLGASSSLWKLVYMHLPPYSSGAVHGSTLIMQWPYQAWGASAVLAGHDHVYERILINGFPYFVNGLGGTSMYAFGPPVSGSEVRYNSDYGALLVDATDTSITFHFISRTGVSVDLYKIDATTPANLLLNPGFERDADGDGKPDSWSTDSRFTRSSKVVHSGSHAGSHSATDNSSYTIGQTVKALTGGATYNVSGWVNIPPTSDSFTFKLVVIWRNANGTISAKTIKTYTGPTGGWNQAAAALVAPPGTTHAQMQMVVSSLNATIYVDEFVFGP